MRALHLFNPETDTALAYDKKDYTVPRKILKIKETFAFLPSIWAKEGDALLIPFSKDITKLPFTWIARKKNLCLLSLDDLSDANYNISPWGWDNHLLMQLRHAGINPSCLPSNHKIDKIRWLSHRRTTIKFHSLWKEITGNNDITSPYECFSLEDALDKIRQHKEIYLKAPWSSSGRGIYHFITNRPSNAEAWVKSCITKQGSVIVEKGEKRKVDFASEWEYKEGRANFKGWAIFTADHKGTYQGNKLNSQLELEKELSVHIGKNLLSIIDIQSQILEKILDRNYAGPLGIDMLLTEQGLINPCVEINLRRTMGSACIDYYNYTLQSGYFPNIETI